MNTVNTSSSANLKNRTFKKVNIAVASTLILTAIFSLAVTVEALPNSDAKSTIKAPLVKEVTIFRNQHYMTHHDMTHHASQNVAELKYQCLSSYFVKETKYVSSEFGRLFC